MWTPLTGPSPHLSWKELASKDGTPYPAEWRKTRARFLAIEFERLRAAVNAPLLVLSGYRTPAHNRRVGGARFSQHVEGRALDLRPPPGWSVERLLAVAKARAREADSQLRGFGVYPTFLHLDIRPSDRLVVWHGGRPAADT